MPNHNPLERTLPTTVATYVIEQRLFESVSYADYDARHGTLGHRVLFRHERWPSRRDVSGTDHALEGLRRSRRLQAELNHPRITAVLDFFEESGEWFSVFAHTAGARTLLNMVEAIRAERRPPCGLDEYVTLSAGITEGLAAVHRAGFVHRTLGTGSVLVDDRHQAILHDLGCATPIGADDEPARAFRSFMRPTTAAPEQYSDDASFSPATDCWALGVALFELRYGRHPFWTVIPPSVPGIVAAILERAPAFPAQSTASPDPVTDGDHLLIPWLTRLLDKDPAQRYQNALEAQRDLDGLAAELAGRPPVARAFVAMPFAQETDEIWRAVSTACRTCRVAVGRADQSHRHDDVWNEICESIQSTDFVIAVASPDSRGSFNPNVMLEIGYARARGKPVLLLTDAADRLPFDLRTQRAMVYEASSVTSGEFFRELLRHLGGLIDRAAPR